MSIWIGDCFPLHAIANNLETNKSNSDNKSLTNDKSYRKMRLNKHACTELYGRNSKWRWWVTKKWLNYKTINSISNRQPSFSCIALYQFHWLNSFTLLSRKFRKFQPENRCFEAIQFHLQLKCREHYVILLYLFSCLVLFSFLRFLNRIKRINSAIHNAIF